ncbi:TnsA endonuclease N-terminal domain-containing protein [Sphingomonas sp. GC_Shp_3]|uniref:TnsA endonuclease N-terminal domain-containing protein n=1 Tax=Sphingomonas sp. GC_Shp_3 TaxID=2937383 RepID=UPI002269E31E|nr:TnsA endonuclease N-terminal domain-containing protein [Sphingomonas sp. GC_Shp_3]
MSPKFTDHAHLPNPASGTRPKFARDKLSDANRVQMIRAENGGALRTFNGGLAHENGWYTSRKAGRVLHWQGAGQYDFLTRAEVEFSVKRVASESVRFEFTRHSKKQIYTIDVELVASDGTITLIEIKRDERDLADPEYRAKLKAVHEICDENGIGFKIIFCHQIWDSLIHRRNVMLFCSRRFVTILPEHIGRLEAHAKQVGTDATFGSTAKALVPNCPRTGEAVFQALTVARRIEIDLTQSLLDTTRATIH